MRLAVDDALLPSLTSILTVFSSRFPATMLELCAVTTSDVLSLVHTGSADLGLMFCNNEFPQGVDLCYVGSLPFNGVVSPTHPLAKLDVVTATELIPHRQLLIRDIEGQALPHCPILSPHVWWGNNFNTINAMVKEGLGWSFIPAHMAEQYVHQNEMVIMNLSFDHKPWQVPIDRVMAKQQARGPALSWLADAITHLWNE
nr:substrate-binding domain-containing protein [Psychromonas hadalis]